MESFVSFVSGVRGKQAGRWPGSSSVAGHRSPAPPRQSAPESFYINLVAPFKPQLSYDPQPFLALVGFFPFFFLSFYLFCKLLVQD